MPSDFSLGHLCVRLLLLGFLVACGNPSPSENKDIGAVLTLKKTFARATQDVPSKTSTPYSTAFAVANESKKIVRGAEYSAFNWSPTRNTLVYAKDGWQSTQPPQFNPTVLVDQQDQGSNAPFWSPDGRKIAFVATRKSDQQDSLWIMNNDGTKLQDLLPGESAIINQGSGKTILRWLNKDTILYQTHCGTGCSTLWQKQLEPNSAIQLFSNNLAYDLSPDKKNIVITSGAYTLSLQSHIGEPLTDLSFTTIPVVQWFQDWSPDSARMVYTNWIGMEENAPLENLVPTLNQWDKHAGKAQLLVPKAAQARWSPQGDRLSVVLFGNPRLDAQGKIAGTDWQPGHPIDLHLILLHTDTETILTDITLGQAKENLSALMPWDFRPVWSPDGEIIIYRKADNSVWTYSLTTKQEKHLLDLDEPNYEIALQAKWSFDSQWLAVGKGDQILIHPRQSLTM